MPSIAASASIQVVGGVKDLFLVFLHVLGIGQRQALHHHHQRGIGAKDAPDLGADQFGRIGVFLLRHDRDPVENRSDSVTKRNCADDQITSSSARRLRCMAQIEATRQKLQREITVADRVQRIGRGPVKAQRLGGHLAVDRKGGARQRRRAQGAIRSSARAHRAPGSDRGRTFRHRPSCDGPRSPAAPSADG